MTIAPIFVDIYEITWYIMN